MITRDDPGLASFDRDEPGHAHLCMLKIASKCYNRAHKHLHPCMEASFFIRSGGRRSAAPSPGPASAWLPSTGAGGVVGASEHRWRWHHCPLILA